jgi:hypothetical protein
MSTGISIIPKKGVGKRGICALHGEKKLKKAYFSLYFFKK